MKRTITFALILVLLFSAVGCSTRNAPAETPEPTKPVETKAPVETEKPKPTEQPEPTEEPQPTEEPGPAYRNPLNGAPMDEPMTARPFTVMINNLDLALPQCGVGQADILYECLAEGGITRMLGVYSDIEAVGKIGPVRSNRPYFLDISLSYGAVIGHAGGSEPAYDRIKNEGLNNIDGVRGVYSFAVFYRDPARMSRGYEHSLFTTGEDLYKCAQEKKYALERDEAYDFGMNFVEDATPADGETAEKIDVAFTPFSKTTNLTYHADTGLYTAVQYSTNFIDGNDGQLVTFRNVITMFAKTRVVDDYGRLAVDLITSGEGSYSCGGKTVPITWSRESLEDCFHFYLADGSDLPVSVGTTYIAIVSEGQGSVKFS